MNENAVEQLGGATERVPELLLGVLDSPLNQESLVSGRQPNFAPDAVESNDGLTTPSASMKSKGKSETLRRNTGRKVESGKQSTRTLSKSGVCLLY